MNHSSFLSIGLIVGCFAGCGQSGQGKGDVTVEVQEPVVQLVSTNWNSPITEREIDQFLQIIQRLPDQKVPTFTRAELSLEPEENESLDDYIAKLRQTLKAAINPTKQGVDWESQKEIANAFQKLNVSPGDFASLATKVSFAWSAASVKGEIPVLLTQRRLNEKLEIVKTELEQPESPENKTQRNQTFLKVQELVAISEFLNFVQQVPEASLTTIRANESRLNDVLPNVSLAAKLEDFFEDKPQVSQLKYSVQ